MTEWWTYRPSDFLLFSARTYYRLFELYNDDLWPAQAVTVGLGLALWLALRQRRDWAPRMAYLLLGAAWLWVAWAFHWQRFALINWAATGFAVAFAVEGLLLLAWALSGATERIPAAQGRSRSIGLAVLFFAVALQPAVGLLLATHGVQDPGNIGSIARTADALGIDGLLVMLIDQSTGSYLIALDPASGEPRWRVLRWQALADGILDAVVSRLLESRRPAERQSPEAMALQERKVAQALAFAEKAHKGKASLVNERLTLADLAFAVALGYTDFRYAHDWRKSHPQLAAWFAEISKRAWFVETRPPTA